MRQHNFRPDAVKRILALAPLAALLIFPCEAAGWSGNTHARIARFALEELPAQWGGLRAFEDDVLAGATSPKLAQNRWAPPLAGQSDIEAEIRLLTSIPHGKKNLSRHFAYRMGVLSRAVADTSLPFASDPRPEHSTLLKTFEADIDRETASYKVRDVSRVFIKYPSSYLDRLSTKSRILEGAVKDAYLSGDGYADCRRQVVEPSLRRAVEASASVWFTILSDDSPPPNVSASDRQDYYIDQIRLSSTKKNYDDVLSALQALHAEGRRIPLTPAIVGKDFFDLPCNTQTSRIFRAAMLIDPRSAVIAEKNRACDEYVLMNPVIEKKKTPKKRRIPGSLHGRGGRAPDIYVYQHDSGLLLLTSKVKEVGNDYVLLNFEPIKRITKKRVVRRFASDPGTAEFDLEAIIDSYADHYNVHPALVKAIIKAESDFDPFAVSGAGARGLMQLMPSTALEMQVDDIFDPIQNVGGGVQYFARMLELFNHDTRLALAAYNAGPGNVLRYGGVPPFKETRRYVPKVMKFYDTYKEDDSPVRLKVALDDKPAADYLPEAVATREIEEMVMTPTGGTRPEPGEYVVVYLRNGNTMRGMAYEKTHRGVRLKLERGWILIREDLITEII